jgi:large subunit ribosomal protein L1
MAETKADLLKQAHDLGLKDITPKSTMAQMREAIAAAAPKKHDKEALPVEKHEAKVAKAGKRSAKAIEESKEKEVKEELKAEAKKTEEAPFKQKVVQKTRSKLERSSKKYREVSKLVEKDKEYSMKEALELAVKTSTTKFDSTVELHVRLGVDPKQADQNIRENIVLPAGTGRTVRVAVFGEADDVIAAKKAGADVAGAEEFLQQLDKGVINFDILIATPAVMAKLGKYARVLGPKGLMPNPKSGTVTKDVVKAVEQARAGKVEFRVDENGIVHLGIGKVSFGADKLMQNLQAVFASLKSAKPSSIKGNYVQTIYVTTSMGPSIKVFASEL